MSSNTQGFSLLEVLICLALLSIMLFGLDAMEITAVRQNRATYFFSVAANQVNNMAERLRALDGISGLEQAVEQWNQENKLVLPQGRGETRGRYPHYQITLFWGGIRSCSKNTIGLQGCLIQKMPA